MRRRPPRSTLTDTLCPYTTRSRSPRGRRGDRNARGLLRHTDDPDGGEFQFGPRRAARTQKPLWRDQGADRDRGAAAGGEYRLHLAVCLLIVIARSEATRQSRVAYTDRKSTRLNSSH